MAEAPSRAAGWEGQYPLPGGATADWRHDPNAQLAYGAFATVQERAVTWLAAIALCLWTGWAARDLGWSLLQWGVALFFAFDVGGGAIANHLNAAKRFYHAPGSADDRLIIRWARNSLLFASAHVHAIIAAAVFSPDALWIGCGWYVGMMVSAALVTRAPLTLARPVAALSVATAIVISLHVPFIDGLEWLPGLLFLKIVLGHVVREEPYSA